MTTGRGMIAANKVSGSIRVRSLFLPQKVQARPAIRRMSESRCRKNSALSFPANKMTEANAMTQTARGFDAAANPSVAFRFAQAHHRAKQAITKPCDALGSVQHSTARLTATRPQIAQIRAASNSICEYLSSRDTE